MMRVHTSIALMLPRAARILRRHAKRTACPPLPGDPPVHSLRPRVACTRARDGSQHQSVPQHWTLLPVTIRQPSNSTLMFLHTVWSLRPLARAVSLALHQLPPCGARRPRRGGTWCCPPRRASGRSCCWPPPATTRTGATRWPPCSCSPPPTTCARVRVCVPGESYGGGRCVWDAHLTGKSRRCRGGSDGGAGWPAPGAGCVEVVLCRPCCTVAARSVCWCSECCNSTNTVHTGRVRRADAPTAQHARCSLTLCTNMPVSGVACTRGTLQMSSWSDWGPSFVLAASLPTGCAGSCWPCRSSTVREGGAKLRCREVRQRPCTLWSDVGHALCYGCLVPLRPVQSVRMYPFLAYGFKVTTCYMV